MYNKEIIKNPKMECHLFNDSSILKQKDDILMLNEWLGNQFKKTSLIYRETRDGFTSAKHHDICVKYAGTIHLIESEYGRIFGFYSSVAYPI